MQCTKHNCRQLCQLGSAIATRLDKTQVRSVIPCLEITKAHAISLMASIDSPIIIIGAGLVGLTLAQGLKKAGFKFEIYDRDNSLHERPAGWGITMHWALPALASCLPPQIFETLLSIQVDPVEGGKGSSGPSCS